MSDTVSERAAPLRFEHDLLELELPAGFVQVPSLDGAQFSFESAERGASVVLSIMPVDIPVEGLMAFAEVFLQARMAAETAARSGASISKVAREMAPDGQEAQVAYAGRDDGCIFQFLGWASNRKFVSLWVGTQGHDDDHALHVLDTLCAGLRM